MQVTKLTLVFLAVLGVAYTAAIGGNSTNEDNGRIFNGQIANIRDYPWMVGVYGEDGSPVVTTCGGALISRNLVLTAEHCVHMPEKRYKITLGSSLPFDNQDGDGKTIRYADLSVKSGDMALLRLSESVSFSDTIRPIRLASANDYVGADTHVYTSGFGGTGSGLSERLYFTTADTLTNQRCGEMYGGIQWKDDVLCGYNRNSIICGGDSGSPVVRFDNGVATHVAVVNARAATPCEDTSLPALFVRTNMYANWLNDEIRRHSS